MYKNNSERLTVKKIIINSDDFITTKILTQASRDYIKKLEAHPMHGHLISKIFYNIPDYIKYFLLLLWSIRIVL